MSTVGGFSGWASQIFYGNRTYSDGRQVDHNGILLDKMQPMNLEGPNVDKAGVAGLGKNIAKFARLKNFFRFLKFSKATKGVGKALNGVDDVLANPNLLQGKSLEQVQSLLGNSKGWVNDAMRKSSRADGWVLREMNQAGTEFTGRMIQYHPGTPRHFGGAPYWKVSSGNGTFRIPLNP